MKIYMDGKYRDMTPEEIDLRKVRRRKAALAGRDRPMTAEEVMGMVLAQQINGLGVDDNTALRMEGFYPVWTDGTAYDAGYMVSRNGLWRCIQGHTAQAGWEPENTPSLWERIQRSYSGTEEDPIPYEGNQRLENGRHYIQGDVVYLCVRDTGNPVYHALSDLVGLYVEVIV